MQPEFVPKLAAVLDGYFTQHDVLELAGLYGVSVNSLYSPGLGWIGVARELTGQLDHGNTRRFVDALLEVAEDRNYDETVHATNERQVFHQDMTPKLRTVRELLQHGAAASEIVLPPGKVFSAPSLLRDLLATATTPVLIVDPYVGPGTLDILRTVETSVLLLTGSDRRALAKGFDVAAEQFIAEGRKLEVRRADRLHDRHLIFNDRCWLIGGSLKDAGKAMFNAIEVVDLREEAVRLITERWDAANRLAP